MKHLAKFNEHSDYDSGYLTFYISRNDFIKWLEKSSFERETQNFDDHWRQLIDYADYIFNYLEVLENSVIFRWETEEDEETIYHEEEYSFSRFIEKYESHTLKY
jgi:hypothetical protein